MPPLKTSLLGGAEIEFLQENVLRVLEDVGVDFGSPRARRILLEAGCAVDGDRIRFPRSLVEWAIGQLRREVFLAGRDPRRDVLLDGSATCVVPAGICPYVADLETGLRREATLDDLAQTGLVCDALDEITALWYPVAPSADTDGLTMNLASLATLLRTTGKHIQGQLNRPHDVPVALEMMRAASPGDDPRERPIFSSLYCPVSPLMHEQESVEAGMAMAEAHLPMLVITLPLAGGTAPVTLAGAIVQNTAETLSAVVLFKLIDEACPLILAGTTGVMDMRSGAFSTSAPEIALLNIAHIELIHAYGAPVMSVGYPTDSYGLSHKAGAESMGYGTLTRLARPDMMLGPGNMEAGNTFSLCKLVLDAELLSYSARLMRGLVVDEAHVAFRSIAEVGPGGNFLECDETVSFVREGEHWRARLLRPTTCEEWSQSGSGAWEEELRACVREILGSHHPMPLPEGAEAEIAALLSQARGSADASLS